MRNRIRAVEWICGIWCIGFALIHILFYHDAFFDINRVKYRLLLCGSGALGAVMCVYAGISAKKGLLRLKRPDLPAVGMLAFALAALVSALCCKDIRAAFTGSGGRCAGALMIFCCAAVFFAARKAKRFTPWIVNALLLSGSACALLGILNFFLIDPLGFYTARLDPKYYSVFFSTIGNVNFFSAYMSLIAGISAGIAVRGRAPWAYASFSLAFGGILVSHTESGFAALAVICVLLFCNTRSLREAGRALLLFSAAMWTAHVISRLIVPRREELTLLEGIGRTILRAKYQMIGLGWATFVSGVSCLIVYPRTERARTLMSGVVSRRVRMAAGIGFLICLAAVPMVMAVLYGKELPSGGLLSYLRFNDRWGTNRGFIWKHCVRLLREFSPVEWLFGVGPDSLRGVFERLFHDEMIAFDNTVYDNAHNEYLQLLLTVGVSGLAAYLVMMFSSVFSAVRRMAKDPYAFACVIALAAYGMQAVFNIAQPETTPAVFLLAGLAVCAVSSGKDGPEETTGR